MEITLNMELDDTALLKKILGCTDENEQNANNRLAVELGKIGRAALQEYIDLFLGKKVFTRAQDILEYRLFLLILNYFDHQIPYESKLSGLFQLTPTESRSLVRSTMAKYQYLLKKSIDDTIKIILEAAGGNDESEYTVIIYNQNLKDEMNNRLGQINPKHHIVTKSNKHINIYQIKPESFHALCDSYNAIRQ